MSRKIDPFTSPAAGAALPKGSTPTSLRSGASLRRAFNVNPPAAPSPMTATGEFIEPRLADNEVDGRSGDRESTLCGGDASSTELANGSLGPAADRYARARGTDVVPTAMSHTSKLSSSGGERDAGDGRERSTPPLRRLGAERSLSQIQSPRFMRARLPSGLSVRLVARFRIVVPAAVPTPPGGWLRRRIVPCPTS